MFISKGTQNPINRAFAVQMRVHYFMIKVGKKYFFFVFVVFREYFENS